MPNAFKIRADPGFYDSVRVLLSPQYFDFLPRARWSLCLIQHTMPDQPFPSVFFLIAHRQRHQRLMKVALLSDQWSLTLHKPSPCLYSGLVPPSFWYCSIVLEASRRMLSFLCGGLTRAPLHNGTGAGISATFVALCYCFASFMCMACQNCLNDSCYLSWSVVGSQPFRLHLGSLLSGQRCSQMGDNIWPPGRRSPVIEMLRYNSALKDKANLKYLLYTMQDI